MNAHPRPVAAYSANILGSLVGIALFVAATVAGLPPQLWLLAAAGGLLALVPAAGGPRWRRLLTSLLLLAPPAIAWTGVSASTVWSPYQKLSIAPMAPSDSEPSCGESVTVNNTTFPLLLNLDLAHMASLPEVYPRDRSPDPTTSCRIS